MKSSKKPLMLVVSDHMDSNKKEDRNEHTLIRMASTARNHMGFTDEVELFTDSSTSKRMNNTALLNVFQAFKGDIKLVKAMVEEGKIKKADLNRIGFVTSKTYKRLTGKKAPTSAVDELWVSDCVEDIILGADPEFILVDPNTGGFIRANNISGMTKQSPLGADGAMAELRPSPSIKPEGVVGNIRGILSDKAQTDKISAYDWWAGCYYKDNSRDYPIGGHIHIGNPAQIAKLDLTTRTLFFKGMNKIMDELLALPMVRLDGKKGNTRRTACQMGKYGFFGEMRLCNGRLEHRTLSGVWLAHPELATAVIGTAKAIVDEIYRHVSHNKFNPSYMLMKGFSPEAMYKDGFKSWDKLPLAKELKCLTSSRDMRKILNDSDSSVISTAFVKKWYSRMKAMTTYSEYKVYIDRLYSILVSPRKRLEGLSMDLKDNWVVGRDLNI